MGNEEDSTKIIRLFRIVAALLIVLLTISTVFFHLIEGWKWLDCLYFSVVTMATVGYGDFVPTTDAGKVGAMVLILLGIGLFGAFANLLLKRQYLRQKEKRSHK